VLSLSNISKRFGTLVAVDDVSLEIESGEVVALAGENGAGKTTLMRIAARELAPDSGSIKTTGGAGFVHQHFLLVDDFTIAENLALALNVDARDASQLVHESGIALAKLDRRVADLSVGERSKVELVKAIAKKPEVLILDEPTSVLTPSESEELFTVMRTFAARGTAIVFISHKIPEVMRVASRFVVMRRGKIVADAKQMTPAALANAMVPSGAGAPGLPAAAVQKPPAGMPALHHDALEVHAGEIVAIIGVAGNGQAELASTLRDRFRRDAGFIPEDRTRDGIVAQMSIAENFALAGTTADAADLIRRFGIRAHGPKQLAGTLSGGNQQKVVLARELGREPKIVVAAEPTRGLDIEATRFVHEQLRNAARRGAAILMMTSDLDEAFALADGVHVIYRGRLSERLTPAEAEHRAGALMAGIE
jgi:simple sugar transport system ATP-binding protein